MRGTRTLVHGRNSIASYRRFFGRPPIRDIKALRDGKVVALDAELPGYHGAACSRLSQTGLGSNELGLSLLSALA